MPVLRNVRFRITGAFLYNEIQWMSFIIVIMIMILLLMYLLLQNVWNFSLIYSVNCEK